MIMILLKIIQNHMKIILKIISELERLVDDANRAFLESAPQMMMKFLDYLREHYGSAKEYLVSCGLEEEKIIEIIENFVI